MPLSVFSPYSKTVDLKLTFFQITYLLKHLFSTDTKKQWGYYIYCYQHTHTATKTKQELILHMDILLHTSAVSIFWLKNPNSRPVKCLCNKIKIIFFRQLSILPQDFQYEHCSVTPVHTNPYEDKSYVCWKQLLVLEKPSGFNYKN